MRTIDVARDLDADPGRVWQALIDTADWPVWGPTVSGGSVDGGSRTLHAGCTGRVRTPVGLALPFEVTAWEDGRRWAWRVGGIPATGHRVEPRGVGGCRAVIEVPAWAVAYVPVCRVALARLGRLAARG